MSDLDRIHDLEQRLSHVRATLASDLDDGFARRTALFYLDSFRPGETCIGREVRLEEEMNADLIDWQSVRGIAPPDY
jgi:hypothetical protein